MEAIFILIPVSLGIVFAAICVFLWAVNNYQFDDLEKEANRILLDDANDRDSIISTTKESKLLPKEGAAEK